MKKNLLYKDFVLMIVIGLNIFLFSYFQTFVIFTFAIINLINILCFSIIIYFYFLKKYFYKLSKININNSNKKEFKKFKNLLLKNTITIILVLLIIFFLIIINSLYYQFQEIYIPTVSFNEKEVINNSFSPIVTNNQIVQDIKKSISFLNLFNLILELYLYLFISTIFISIFLSYIIKFNYIETQYYLINFKILIYYLILLVYSSYNYFINFWFSILIYVFSLNKIKKFNNYLFEKSLLHYFYLIKLNHKLNTPPSTFYLSYI